jgi:trehalose synthase
VTSLDLEHFGPPSTTREARVLAYAEECAADELCAHRIWCATALPAGHRAAHVLRERLRRLAEPAGAPRELAVATGELSLELARRLDRMLRGRSSDSESLGSAERAICTEVREDGDALVGRHVQRDDVVVLHDPLTALLAEAVRERGAHAVWSVELQMAHTRGAAARARTFLNDYTGPVHAYVLASSHVVAALIPSTGVVAAKEIDTTPPYDAGRRDRLGWAAALADALRDDRAETVGGVLHARPSVAAR